MAAIYDSPELYRSDTIERLRTLYYIDIAERQREIARLKALIPPSERK